MQPALQSYAMATPAWKCCRSRFNKGVNCVTRAGAVARERLKHMLCGTRSFSWQALTGSHPSRYVCKILCSCHEIDVVSLVLPGSPISELLLAQSCQLESCHISKYGE